MKAVKICGWIFFAIAVIHYLIGIFSGEFTRSILGIPFFGTSMKSIWLTCISASCLILSAVLLVTYVVKKRKDE